MIIVGVDAGCGHSAAVRAKIHPGKPPEVLEHVDLPNDELLEWIFDVEADLIVFECMLSNGGASQEVIDTAYWNGRFWTAAAFTEKAVTGLTRRSVRKLLFNKDKGGDKEVRQYCVEAYGFKEGKDATGTKKKPGILFGISNHKWQALGVLLATVKAMRTGKAEEFYWDPLYTTSEKFKEARTKRREAKKAKQERAALKGQKGGALSDKMNQFKKQK